jgi:hypothetical protein
VHDFNEAINLVTTLFQVQETKLIDLQLNYSELLKEIKAGKAQWAQEKLDLENKLKELGANLFVANDGLLVLQETLKKVMGEESRRNKELEGALREMSDRAKQAEALAQGYKDKIEVMMREMTT